MPAEHKNTTRTTTMDSKPAHHVNKKIKSNSINHAPVIKNIWTQPTKVSFNGFAPLSSPSSLPSPTGSASLMSSVPLTPSSLAVPTSSPSSSTADGTILTGSSIPIPPQESNSSSSSPSAAVLGGVISGIIFLLSILLYALYRKLKKTKRKRMAIGHQHEYDKNWKQTQSWSTLASNTSSKFADMNAPPPAYYCTSQTKKRWTQDSVISKQASFVKQYSPQLAYSPSNHSVLQMDHDGISPSHTLVDTSGASWLHQKELHLPEYDSENPQQQQQQQQHQQRRSIQPYQAQLDISSSFSDALETPGPYQSGILLYTKEFHPSTTS
ncbi:unnamed protein product [Absidia cylindrospora]